MKIKIEKEPLGNIDFNLKKFKKMFASGNNFEESIKSNLYNLKTTLKQEECDIKEYIYYSSDWNSILMLDPGNMDIIQIYLYKCHIFDFKKYEPDVKNNNGTITFKEKNIDFVDFIVPNTLNRQLDKHIEYMLSWNVIDYDKKKWKLEIDLDE